MAYYALLDDTNTVIHVITGVDEDIVQIDVDGSEIGGSTEAWEDFYASRPWFSGMTCKRTSYNDKIRKQFAGIGFRYLPIADVFVVPQPFPSWSLDENYDWQPPKPRPSFPAIWDEAEGDWVSVTQS